MASKATLEQQETVPVHKDPEILAAAQRMAGEDLCSIADLSSAEVRAIIKLGLGSNTSVSTPPIASAIDEAETPAAAESGVAPAPGNK